MTKTGRKIIIIAFLRGKSIDLDNYFKMVKFATLNLFINEKKYLTSAYFVIYIFCFFSEQGFGFGHLFCRHQQYNV